MRIQATVWCDDTITVEVIVGSRILTVVATIGKDGASCHRTLVAHTLIHEVPDIATLIFRILTYQVPVFLETTHGVTHGVGIFTLDEWTGIAAL